MDPLGVVVGNIISEQTPEMAFAEDDHVIEKLSSTRSYPPLGDRVLPGAAVRRAYGLDSKVADRSGDLCREDRVTVVDEKGRAASEGKAARSCWITQDAVGFVVTLK